MLSRETMLLANNVLLIVAMAAVMLGTLYPLILDAFGLGKISVGPPYFNAVYVPIMAVLMFFMGVGPLSRWKNDSLPALAVRLRWAAGVAVVSAALTAWGSGGIGFGGFVGLLMAYWILYTVVAEIWDRVQPSAATALGGSTVWQRLGQLPRASVGMWVAHAGTAMFVFGVTMVSVYDIEKDVAMGVGESTTVRGYTFTYQGSRPVNGPNYEAIRGHLIVTRDGQQVSEMFPEKRVYRVQRMPMTEAAIDTRWHGDLYVQMGEPLAQDKWLVRIWVKPFVTWIWIGCMFMGLGGIWAITDRRYRQRVTRSSTAPTGAAGAAV
jgi:cytochrome c-type biogenesis protein CcmF